MLNICMAISILWLRQNLLLKIVISFAWNSQEPFVINKEIVCFVIHNFCYVYYYYFTIYSSGILNFS